MAEDKIFRVARALRYSTDGTTRHQKALPQKKQPTMQHSGKFASTKINLPQYPGRQCHPHEHERWLEDVNEILRSHGMTEVMNNGDPVEALKYPTVELLYLTSHLTMTGTRGG